MKAGASTLNPYAESYVPLSKRRGADERNDFKFPGVQAKRGSESAVLGPRHWDPTILAPQIYDSHYSDAFYAAENTKLKGYTNPGFHGSSSYSPAETAEKATFEEESDIDLAYLQMTFPSVSEESLADAYKANNYDLDATIDMLTHLEAYPVDSKLPDTLDIGDVPESGSAGELLKLKDVNTEAGASSSGLSGMAPAV
nr:polyadenylate-binding protein-interacting protein 6-like [Coffea arabica]